MASYYKILGQALPVANTFTDIYTVPNTANAVVSTVNICNVTNGNVTFRLLARPRGNTIATQQYIAYDVPILPQDATSVSLGMSLGASDVLTVFSFQGNTAFTVFGTEIQ
jgi:hypothetical protein